MMQFLKKSNNCYKASGYSAVELLFVLAIIIGLILITNSMLSVMAKSRHNNQIADQVKVYQKAAIMYITDNYREIVLNIFQTGNNEVIAAGGNNGYLHSGVMPMLSTGQAPCLYITKDDKNKLSASIRAYLIFGNVSTKSKSLSFKDAMSLANAIGGAAGVMMPTANGFKVQGLNFNGDLRFDYNLNIATQCGFSGGRGASGIPDNSIIIDLTADDNFFQQLVSVINPNNNIPPPKNPSLQKSGGTDATGMRTNLYLDNVISEARTEINYYCDASKASQHSNADTICQAYANNNGYSVVPGSSYWYSSIKTGEQSCTGNAKANFTRVIPIKTCDGVNFGDPSAYNGASSQPGFLNAKWSAPTLIGDQCTATDIISICGQYTSTMNTGGDCHWKTISCTPGQIMHTDGCQGSGGRDYMCGRCLSGGDPMDHNACWNQVCSNLLPETNYATISKDAIVDNTIQSLGELICGTDKFQAEKATNYIPPQHRYRGLNLGDGAIQGQKIQVKSDAPTGAALGTSVLKISHAGIQSGTIGLASHTVSFGDSCDSTELGKIVQQNSSTQNDIQAQLRCTFSQVSCAAPGYCYLPVKSASREIHFNQKEQIASCPNELVVDANQPSDLLDSNVKCPDLSSQNYSLIQNIHEESYGCYQSGMSGISFCSSIKSVCTYRDSGGSNVAYSMAALLGIQCVAKNNTFVVNDYKQN